jgi:hypothetical protein
MTMTATSERPDRDGPPKSAHRMGVLAGVVLYSLGRLPWDKRFQRNVIAGVVGLVALAQMFRQGTKESYQEVSHWTMAGYVREKQAEHERHEQLEKLEKQEKQAARQDQDELNAARLARQAQASPASRHPPAHAKVSCNKQTNRAGEGERAA